MFGFSQVHIPDAFNKVEFEVRAGRISSPIVHIFDKLVWPLGILPWTSDKAAIG